MTPVEFNKTGAQAQLEIFETYFDSLNQQMRVPQTSADYSNRVVSLEEKLSIFKEFGNATSVSASNVFDLPQQFSGQANITTVTNPLATAAATTQYTIQTATTDQISNGVVQVFGNGVLISDTEYTIAGDIITFNSQPSFTPPQTLVVNIYPKQFYKLGQALHNAGGTTIPQELQEVGRNELYHLLSSDLTTPNANNIIYLYEKNQLTVYPTTIVNGIEVAYIRKPLPPVWNFTTGSNNQYIFNPSTSFNFELNPTEQTELILKILLYAGVVVKSPEIVQVAAQQVAQENINQQR